MFLILIMAVMMVLLMMLTTISSVCRLDQLFVLCNSRWPYIYYDYAGFDVEHGDDYGDGDNASDDVDHY